MRLIKVIIFIFLGFNLFSQGLEPNQIQASTYKNGILKAVTKVFDEWTGDTVYYYKHDTLLAVDSIYITNDSIFCYRRNNIIKCDTLQYQNDSDSTVITDGYGTYAYEMSANNWKVEADTNQVVTPFDISQLDQSATNEIQTLSADSTATTIGITSSINNSRVHFSVLKSEVDGSTTNEIQNLSKSKAGNNVTVNISNGTGTTFSIADADSLSTNEIQGIDTFRINNNILELSLSSDNEIKKTVDLAPYLNVAETDPFFAADSNKIVHFSDTLINIATPYDISQTEIDSFYLKTNGQLRLKQKGYDTKIVSSMIYGGSSLGANYLPIWAGGQNLTNYWGSGLTKVTAGVLSTVDDNSTNWNSAYGWGNHATAGYLTTDQYWTGTSTNLNASTGRTSLGGTTIGQSMFMLTNPSAITFPRFNADNTVSALSASDFRTAIGAGTFTLPSLTSGSVLFSNGTTITQDNSNFFWDNTNKRLGIGIATPAEKIDMGTSGAIKLTQNTISEVYLENTGLRLKNIYTGAGAWARELMKYTNSAAATYFGFGAVGVGQTGYYGYMGHEYYGAALKISTPNTIDAVNRIGINVPIDSRPLYVLDVRGTPGFFNSGIYGTLDDAMFIGNLNNLSAYRNKIQSSVSGTPNESKLVFSLSTGAATYANVLFLQGDNKVGIANTNPQKSLHITGDVRVSTLDTDLTPPATSGTTKMVITDANGDLSFASIPASGVTGTGVNGQLAKWTSATNITSLIGTGYLKGNGSTYTFDNSTFLTNSLADGKILVGNGFGTAQAQTMSGDATMSNAGVVAVADNSHSHNNTTITTNIVSSVEGVINDGGNIDMIGDGISVTGDDANDNITFAMNQKFLKAFASDSTKCTSNFRKIKFNTEIYDTGGFTVNSGGNYSIQFPSTGYYEIDIRLYYTNVGGSDEHVKIITWLNGSYIASDITEVTNNNAALYMYKTIIQVTNTAHLLTSEVVNTENNNQYVYVGSYPTIMIKKISN